MNDFKIDLIHFLDSDFLCELNFKRYLTNESVKLSFARTLLFRMLS